MFPAGVRVRTLTPDSDPGVLSVMRTLLSALAIAILMTGCRSSTPTADERATIAAEIEREVKSAYDLKSPDVVKSLQALYPDSGRVVLATGGRIITSRDTIFQGIRDFWQFVGSNMQNPQWMWDRFHVDVLSRDAAVMTATYHVPHTTPAGRPHIIGGAWTAVFRRNGAKWVIVQEHLSDIPPALADSAHANMNHPPK
jgi:ketosteroid isomerase-like protein